MLCREEHSVIAPLGPSLSYQSKMFKYFLSRVTLKIVIFLFIATFQNKALNGKWPQKCFSVAHF